MSTRTTNTFAEWLNRVAQDIADAMGLPDADIPFLTGMLDAVTAKRREPLDQVTAMMQQQGTQGMPPGGMPGMQAPMQPQPNGVTARPQMPNMDEMARLLSR